MLEMKKDRLKNREQRFDDVVKVLPKPGLQPIEQVELFTKFRPVIPEPFRDAVRPEPTAEVMAMVRAEKKVKRVNKKSGGC